MSKVTFIGDLHGKYRRYHEIIREKKRHPYTVQLGDFGFDYSTLDNVDSSKHKVLGGNHDNYDKIGSIPHYLGDFGVQSLNGLEFFFYRGAYSIDKSYRTIGLDWWSQEELKIERFFEARELYRKTLPSVVISHDCPPICVPSLLDPGSHIFENITGYCLGELFNIHQPDYWIFGHYHKDKVMNFDGVKTTFVCVAECSTYKL